MLKIAFSNIKTELRLQQGEEKERSNAEPYSYRLFLDNGYRHDMSCRVVSYRVEFSNVMKWNYLVSSWDW